MVNICFQYFQFYVIYCYNNIVYLFRLYVAVQLKHLNHVKGGYAYFFVFKSLSFLITANGLGYDVLWISKHKISFIYCYFKFTYLYSTMSNVTMHYSHCYHTYLSFINSYQVSRFKHCSRRNHLFVHRNSTFVPFFHFLLNNIT